MFLVTQAVRPCGACLHNSRGRATGPRCAALPWWPGHLGKLGVGQQGSEPAQGRPPAAGSRAETPVPLTRTKGAACISTHPQRSRRRRVEIVPERMTASGATDQSSPSQFLIPHPASAPHQGVDPFISLLF
jgi:hypothetical protein